MCGWRTEKVNLGNMVRGELVSHPQVRGQGCQHGPLGADVTQWEDAGSQADLYLEMTSQRHNTPSVFFLLSKGRYSFIPKPSERFSAQDIWQEAEAIKELMFEK